MGVVLLWEARAMSEQNALVSAGGAQGTSSEQTAGSRRRREEAEEEETFKGGARATDARRTYYA
jgi:hypothetical protein